MASIMITVSIDDDDALAEIMDELDDGEVTIAGYDLPIVMTAVRY